MSREPDHVIRLGLIKCSIVRQNTRVGDRFNVSVSRLFRKGVLVAGTMSNSETVRFEPALNIPDILIDEILNRLEDTLREVREGRH